MNGAHRSAKISSIRFSAAPASVRWDERIAQLGPKHGDFARLLTGSMDMHIDDFTVRIGEEWLTQGLVGTPANLHFQTIALSESEKHVILFSDDHENAQVVARVHADNLLIISLVSSDAEYCIERSALLTAIQEFARELVAILQQRCFHPQLLTEFISTEYGAILPEFSAQRRDLEISVFRLNVVCAMPLESALICAEVDEMWSLLPGRIQYSSKTIGARDFVDSGYMGLVGWIPELSRICEALQRGDRQIVVMSLYHPSQLLILVRGTSCTIVDFWSGEELLVSRDLLTAEITRAMTTIGSMLLAWHPTVRVNPEYANFLGKIPR